MATILKSPITHRVLLDNISWQTYERLLREVGERHVRLTYDDGDLEIMTLSYAHENAGEHLSALVLLLCIELGLRFAAGGSTTLRRRLRKKGLEPDKCFWFTSERLMRGKGRWRADKDPPPDLALEIDISRSSLNRAGIYAALRVPEVWRFNRRILRVYRLTAAGRYKASKRSGVFPFLNMTAFAQFAENREGLDELTLLQRYAEWLRNDVKPRFEAWRQRNRKNGQ
jgi:Uma2 family endonuclease